MSINDTIGQVAATNPTVGVAVANAQTNSTLLFGLTSGDSADTSLMGAASAQAMEANTLLNSLEPNLGNHINLMA